MWLQQAERIPVRDEVRVEGGAEESTIFKALQAIIRTLAFTLSEMGIVNRE